MRSGFTLIEVLFAIVLISTMALAMLQSVGNNTKLMGLAKENKRTFHQLSLLSGNADESMHSKEKSLYDLLEKKYDFDDDTRRYLDSIEYEIEVEELDTIDLKIQESNEQSASFLLKRMKFSDEQNSAHVYSLEVME